MKTCKVCGKEKLEAEFYKRKNNDSRAKSDPCRECSLAARKADYHKRSDEMSKRAKIYRKLNPEKIRDTKLKQTYGVGIDYFNTKLKEQGGVCAGCRQNVKTIWKGKEVNMALDHDHLSGKVRGVLCMHCNRGLGSLRDNEETLNNLIDYLRKYKKLG
jgi:Recombination endonuclease VII